MRLQAWLCDRGALNNSAIDDWRGRCDGEVRGLLSAVEGIEAPALESLFEDVWATPPPHLLTQRQGALSHARNGDAAG